MLPWLFRSDSNYTNLRLRLFRWQQQSCEPSVTCFSTVRMSVFSYDGIGRRIWCVRKNNKNNCGNLSSIEETLFLFFCRENSRYFKIQWVLLWSNKMYILVKGAGMSEANGIYKIQGQRYELSPKCFSLSSSVSQRWKCNGGTALLEWMTDPARISLLPLLSMVDFCYFPFLLSSDGVDRYECEKGFELFRFTIPNSSTPLLAAFHLH